MFAQKNKSIYAEFDLSFEPGGYQKTYSLEMNHKNGPNIRISSAVV